MGYAPSRWQVLPARSPMFGGRKITRRNACMMLAGAAVFSPAGNPGAQPLAPGFPPQTVYVIRHGEKPADKGDRNLIAQGWARAAMLAREAGRIFPDLAYVFATAPAHGSPSCREIETVQPLSDLGKIPADFGFGEGQETDLAHEIYTAPIYKDRVILICWHHSRIPALLHAFGLRSKVEKPDEEEFGLVWRLTYGGEHSPALSMYSQPDVTAADHAAADGLRRRATDRLRADWPRCFK